MTSVTRSRIDHEALKRRSRCLDVSWSIGFTSSPRADDTRSARYSRARGDHPRTVPTCSGASRSCHPSSLIISTGARSQAPRHSTSINVNMPSAVVWPGRDAELGAQFLGHPLGAEQRARQRAADVEHVLPDRLRVEHRVVRHDVLDFGGRAANLLRHEPHRRAGDRIPAASAPGTARRESPTSAAPADSA